MAVPTPPSVGSAGAGVPGPSGLDAKCPDGFAGTPAASAGKPLASPSMAPRNAGKAEAPPAGLCATAEPPNTIARPAAPTSAEATADRRFVDDTWRPPFS